jgi:ribosomal protein L40E
MLLWDSGCRIGEVMPLRVGDISFDQYGAVVLVSGKTGRRRLRLTGSVPDLQAWMNIDPLRKDPSAPLWTTHRRYGSAVRALNDQTVRNNLKAIARRAGISGRVYPHLLRHARLTDLVRSDGKRKGLNEMELRIVAGWERSSIMPATYIHLSGADVEQKILENAGITETLEEEDPALDAVRCPRCHALNTPGAMFCSRCSMALSRDALHEIELLRQVDNDPDILIRIAEEMKKKRALPVQASSLTPRTGSGQ